MNLSVALPLAESLLEAMRPYCEWVAIAGSIRREKSENIKDIEIVAMPKWLSTPDPADLFGEKELRQNLLYSWAMGYTRPSHAVRWIKPGTSEIIPWQPNEAGKYWRGMIYQDDDSQPPVKLDLFLVTQETRWPVFVIRTGSAEFSTALMTRAIHLGMRFKDGTLGRETQTGFHPLTSLSDEESLFEALQIQYVAPRNRTGPEAIRPLGRRAK